MKKYLPQLESILEHVDKLNELDTTAIEPMAQVTYAGSENAALRARQGNAIVSRKGRGSRERAPDAGAGCFQVVPSVIERED